VAKTATRKASIDRITLPDLDDDGTLLRSRDSREAERYTGVDLDGRDLMSCHRPARPGVQRATVQLA
jgi:hypothetical protein